MAIIYSYPNVTPLGEDFLIGSQKSSSNATKNFTVDSVVQAGLGYTVYTALLTQTGTNAPVATILKNNTGVTYTWARTSTGEYTITASGNAFTNNKTLICLMGQRAFNIPLSFRRDSDTVISLFSGDSSGTSTDGVIADLSFEIRIYS